MLAGARWRRGLGIGLAFAAAGVASAQDSGQAPRFRVETRQETKSWTETEPPSGFHDLAAGEEHEVSRLPEPEWPGVRQMSDAALAAETERLKGARAARVQALTQMNEELQALTTQLAKARTEAKRKEAGYRRALVNYRVAAEDRQVRMIARRLDALNAERARRRPTSFPPVSSDPTTWENVQQVHAAVRLLAQYDEAVGQVLRREPFTEADVIYALGLLEEKAAVQQMVADYMALLERHAQESPAEAPAGTEARP